MNEDAVNRYFNQVQEEMKKILREGKLQVIKDNPLRKDEDIEKFNDFLITQWEGNKNDIRSFVSSNTTNAYKTAEALINKYYKMTFVNINNDQGNLNTTEFSTDNPINGERSMNTMERIITKFDRFCESVELHTELSGKYGFNAFLNLINKGELEFTKTNFLNTGDFTLFFFTDRIKNMDDLVDELEYKRSLEFAYKTLVYIKTIKLSYYFGIKDNVLEYGFFDDLKDLVYKVGEFVITPKYIKDLEGDCFRIIRKTLRKINLKDLITLHIVKRDFVNFFKDITTKTEIMDDIRIVKTLKCEHFKEEDLDDFKMTFTLENWAGKYKWFKKCKCYTHVTEEYVHFYIKILKDEYEIS